MKNPPDQGGLLEGELTMLDLLNSTKTNTCGQVLRSVPETKRTVSKKAAAWFLDRVEQSRARVFTEIATITPERAEMLLTVNMENRNPNTLHVAALAADMVAKRWEINGESIKVSVDGELNDGQHRLLAVLEGGVAIDSAITWGVSRDSRTTLDQGKVRTVGDYLHMSGPISYANSKAAAARLLLGMRLGVNEGRQAQNIFTKAAIMQEYYNLQSEIDWAADLVLNHKPLRGAGTASIVAAVLIGRVNKKEAEAFARQVSTGEDLSGKSPILYVRDRLLTDRLKTKEKIELLIRAFNAAKRGGRGKLPVMGNIPKVER